MKTITEVHKFGGKFFKVTIMFTFVEFFQKAAKSGNRILFVVSAVEGVTRLLRLIFEAKIERLNKDFKDLVISLSMNEFRRIHLDLISELFSGEDRNKAKIHFEKIFLELSEGINSYHEGDNEDKFYPAILKFGELASSMILNYFLFSIGINNVLFDARDYVETEDNYKDARILRIDRDFQKVFNISNVSVTQGFIARDFNGEDTVLGFDGSDLSASFFSGELAGQNDVSLNYWKDVKGIYKEDPTLNPNAEIRYKMTLSEYKMLKTRPIRLDAVSHAIRKGITVYMRNFLSPVSLESKIVKG